MFGTPSPMAAALLGAAASAGLPGRSRAASFWQASPNPCANISRKKARLARKKARKAQR